MIVYLFLILLLFVFKKHFCWRIFFAENVAEKIEIDW